MLVSAAPRLILCFAAYQLGLNCSQCHRFDRQDIQDEKWLYLDNPYKHSVFLWDIWKRYRPRLIDTLDTDIGCVFSTIVLYHTKEDFCFEWHTLVQYCILTVKPMGWIVCIKVDCQLNWGRLLKPISSLYRPESELFWSILLASRVVGTILVSKQQRVTIGPPTKRHSNGGPIVTRDGCFPLKIDYTFGIMSIV